MTEVAEHPPRQAVVHAPAIEAHRLIGDGRSAALILPSAAIDWWCAPAFDSPPLLWWLLDADGAVARWSGARTTGPAVDTFGGAGGEKNARAYEVYGYAFLARRAR